MFRSDPTRRAPRSTIVIMLPSDEHEGVRREQEKSSPITRTGLHHGVIATVQTKTIRWLSYRHKPSIWFRFEVLAVGIFALSRAGWPQSYGKW
jgi:hypothetical protein